jgi:hypothetical protein
MDTNHTAATCFWLTPTAHLPHPYSFDAIDHPWSCLRDGPPRPLDFNDLHACATCARWEPRTFESAKRDLVFEAWGVGIPVPRPCTFDDVKRDLVLEAWGVGREPVRG